MTHSITTGGGALPQELHHEGIRRIQPHASGGSWGRNPCICRRRGGGIRNCSRCILYGQSQGGGRRSQVIYKLHRECGAASNRTCADNGITKYPQYHLNSLINHGISVLSCACAPDHKGVNNMQIFLCKHASRFCLFYGLFQNFPSDVTVEQPLTVVTKRQGIYPVKIPRCRHCIFNSIIKPGCFLNLQV